MKIAILNDALPRSSLDIYSSQLFNEMKKMDKEVETIFFQYGARPYLAEPKTILIKGIQLPLLDHTFNNLIYFPMKIPKGFDIYHITNEKMSYLCKKLEKCIVTCHDLKELVYKNYYSGIINSLYHNLFYRIKINSIKNAQMVIAVSDSTKKNIIKYLKIPEDRIRVIYLGVDNVFKLRDKTKIRKILHLPKNKKILLHVGSEEPRKNIPSLIKAFYKLQRELPNTLLVRIGLQGVKESEKTRELIKNLKLSNKFIYLNNLTREELALFYNAADIFVLPSYYEGFGLPVIEAMASGCPVIAGNSSSLPEITNGASLLVDPMNIDCLYKKMLLVLRNDELRKELIKRGIARSRKFSWKRCAKETYKVYEEVYNM